MHLAVRIVIAVVIVAVDVVSFLVPLGSLAIAWVIVARPRWALELVVKLYADKEFGEPEQATEPRAEPPGRE
jgi:hypothetical protein